jgi:hypothetical protein
MVNQSHLNVIPGRSAAEGKGIHDDARVRRSPSLTTLAGDDKREGGVR